MRRGSSLHRQPPLRLQRHEFAELLERMMVDFFNFDGTWIIAQHNWWLLLAALGLGAWVGWKTCVPRETPH